ncbi:hypothetical protein ACPCG0_13400 [Propionibacteriaceae bacterium Y1923]
MLGYTVTSVARTIVDLARLRGAEDDIITWEAALWLARENARLGELQQAVAEVLGRCRRRKGVVVARELARFASPFSESPQESRSRAGCPPWTTRTRPPPADAQVSSGIHLWWQ